MSAEFRQRTPGEYARILWRRKWMIALPAFAIAFAVAIVVWRLPNVYESTTLLTVRPASISTSVVPQLSDNDLTIRINNIGQEVVSRTSLEPLIERYNLYQAERRRGEPMDVLVERMRTRDINVQINTSRNDVTNGFYLSFRSSDPRASQAVTRELATKYVDAQNQTARDESTQTEEFFSERLRQAKEELDAIDARRLAFMQSRSSSLPGHAPALIGQLTGLREQQKTLMMEIGRLRDQRTSVTNLISTLAKAREQQIMDVAEQVGDPKATSAYAELVKRKAQLEAERQNLITVYRPKHPDVISVQNQIDSIQGQMNTMVEEGKQKVEEKRKQLTARVDPQLDEYRGSVARIDGEIARQQRVLEQSESQIAQINAQLGGVPGTDVGLETINREYESKKAVYENMLTKQTQASIEAGVTANAQGETIAVIDAASMPERPVAPNRPLLMGAGLIAGLCCGLFFAALFEVPRLLTIQTAADAEHYTGLPVLVSLPNLLTPREERRLKLRRVALATAGVAATVISIPALALALRFTRLIELFASRG